MYQFIDNPACVVCVYLCPRGPVVVYGVQSVTVCLHDGLQHSHDLMPLDG